MGKRRGGGDEKATWEALTTIEARDLASTSSCSFMPPTLNTFFKHLHED